MHPLCIQIFEQIHQPECWQYEMDWSNMLQRALSDTGHGQHAARISTVMTTAVGDFSAVSKAPLEYLKGFKLVYRVPAPIELVVSSTAMVVYNEVFTLLMQLKWVTWRLNGIQSQGAYERNPRYLGLNRVPLSIHRTCSPHSLFQEVHHVTRRMREMSIAPGCCDRGLRM